jgi:hypothetical protein
LQDFFLQDEAFFARKDESRLNFGGLPGISRSQITQHFQGFVNDTNLQFVHETGSKIIIRQNFLKKKFVKPSLPGCLARFCKSFANPAPSSLKTACTSRFSSKMNKCT